jgi:hypothetical protein
MTGPRPWDSGPASDEYFRQLAQFNATRDQFYNRLYSSLDSLGKPQQPEPQPARVVPTAAQQQQGAPVGSDWSDPDLLGAARYWGMPETVARQMPRDELVKWVNNLRQGSRPDESTFAGRLGAAGDMLLSVPEMFGVGAGEALTGLAQNLPLVGPALRRQGFVHEADMYLRGLEESIRSSTPDSFKNTLSGINMAGNIGSTWFPAAGAWKLAGAGLGWVGSPILRGALQGGVSGYLLEGGSDHPGAAVGLGGALGGALPLLAPAFEALATKVSKQFLSPAMLQDVEGESWPINRMNQASDMSRLASAAQQGDPSAIAMMQSLGHHGAPTDYLPNWNEAQMGPKPSFEQYQQFQLNASQTLGEVAARGRQSERQFFPSGYPFKGMSDRQAEAVATQMNKASTIVESPKLPEIARQTAPDDFSVLHAANATNPGGTNIVEGIADPGSVARWNEIGNIAFAQRNGRLAAIISDRPIGPEVVGSFEQHGAYPGQQVLTRNGVAGTIQHIGDDGIAAIKPLYSDVLAYQHVNQVSPSTSSPGVVAVPHMWQQFQAYADAQAIKTQFAMGGGLGESQLAAVRQASLPEYMENFLDESGITSEGDRARIKNYFNEQYVQSFKAAAPVEVAGAEAIIQHMNETQASIPQTPVGALDSMADTKGYVAIPNGEGGWNLRNRAPGVNGAVSPVDVSFNSADAAQSWLNKINRELPDISPPSTVPGELAGVLYREPTQLPNANDQLERAITGNIAELAEGNGGIPVVPPADVSDAAASGNWGRLKNLWNSGFQNWMPMRARFAQISGRVREIAGDDFGIAHDYDQLTNQLINHHNAMHEPTNRLADILAPVGTKRMITGEFMRTWQIGDDATRLAVAQKLGWSNQEIQSLGKFSQLVSDVAGQDVNASLREYVGQIAQRQSVPELFDTAWQQPATNDAIAAWQEHASTTNMNVRELDPRVFGESFIRSVFWKRDMAPLYDPIMQKWEGYTGSGRDWDCSGIHQKLDEDHEAGVYS